MKKTVLLFLLSLLLSIETYAETDSLEIQSLRQRVNLLEDYKSNTDKLYEARHQELLTKETKFENDYNLKQTWWQLLVAFFLGGGITFLSLKNWVKEKADEYFKKNIQDVFNGKSDAVRQILHEYDTDHLLKTEKKILIVSKVENSDVFKRIKSNFIHVSQLIFSEATKKDIKGIEFDLAVFDSIEEIKNEKYDIVYSILLDNKKVFVHNVRIDDPNLTAKIGSSNLLSQIIGNIMNLLKYN